MNGNRACVAGGHDWNAVLFSVESMEFTEYGYHKCRSILRRYQESTCVHMLCKKDAKILISSILPRCFIHFNFLTEYLAVSPLRYSEHFSSLQSGVYGLSYAGIRGIPLWCMVYRQILLSRRAYCCCVHIWKRKGFPVLNLVGTALVPFGV